MGGCYQQNIRIVSVIQVEANMNPSSLAPALQGRTRGAFSGMRVRLSSTTPSLIVTAEVECPCFACFVRIVFSLFYFRFKRMHHPPVRSEINLFRWSLLPVYELAYF